MNVMRKISAIKKPLPPDVRKAAVFNMVLNAMKSLSFFRITFIFGARGQMAKTLYFQGGCRP